jgi:Protein of unknown function (DUF1236)
VRKLEALLLRLLVLLLSLASVAAPASAQSNAPTATPALSLEQQTKLSDAITRDAGTPIPAGLFPLVVDKEVPGNVPLRPVPATAAAAAPQFKEASYVVVEEQIAIVDPHTRKILAVIQRGRSQTTGSVPITDCIAAADIKAGRPRGPLHCLLQRS